MRLENNHLFRDLESRFTPPVAGPSAPSFVQSLGNALREIDRGQIKNDDDMDATVRGQGPELHKVLPEAEEAGLAFQLTMQFRTKVLDAYQEVMRMQL